MIGRRAVFASMLAFLGCWTVGARGQTPTPDANRLDVSRGADAQGCPDAARLSGDVAAIRGAGAAPTTIAYSVDFARSGRTFSASIRSGPTGANVRRLEAPGQTCAALAHAVAVTLAVLFDSDKAPTADSTPEPAAPREPRAALVPLRPDAEAPVEGDRKHANEATLTLGGTGLIAVLRPFAPALAGELGLEIGRWRTGLGVVGVLPQSLALGPGTVRASLLGGSMRACFAPWLSDGWRVDLCSGAFVALVKAEGQGYTQNVARTQPWLAVPLELAVAVFTGPVGWELGAGGLASLERPDFTVTNLGIAYRSPPVGATVSLRAIGRIPW